MLENVFEDMHRKYHIFYDKSAGKRRIADDCPSDRFAELKKVDADFFEETGKHLYANFEENDKK